MSEKRKLTRELLVELNADNVKAIQFADVGAQGNPGFLTIVSRDCGVVFLDSGSFGFEFAGERVDGDVEIEDVTVVFPFLAECLGISPQTTVRGHGLMSDGRWFHLDAGCGNHLFVLNAYIREFLQKLDELPKGDARELIYLHGLSIVCQILESQGGAGNE